MSLTFTKLFSSITESTVWCESEHTRLVWITMLAMSDRQGRVWASIPGLANRARVPVEGAENAIAIFLAPDKYSRTSDYEGRRIEPIDGGWRLLNYEKFRAIRDSETIRETARDHMRRKRSDVDEPREQLTSVDHSSHIAEAEAEAEADKPKNKPEARATRLQTDWVCPIDWITWALEKQPTWTQAHAEEIAASFKDYWIGAPGAYARKLDWLATWRNKVRHEAPMRQAPPAAVKRDRRCCFEDGGQRCVKQDDKDDGPFIGTGDGRVRCYEHHVLFQNLQAKRKAADA